MNILHSINRFFSKVPPPEQSIDFEESIRCRLFIVFCISILIPLIPFGILYVANKQYSWGFPILLATAAISVLLIILRIRRFRKTIYRLSVIIFLFLLTSWTYSGTIRGFGSLWFLASAPYAFFLLGKREGTIWCVGVVLLLALIFFNPLSLPGVFSYSLDYYGRYLILYCIILLFTHYYETIRERFKNSLMEEHDNLLQEKERLLLSKKDLENANALLNEEISVRKKIEDALLEHKENLERIVTERTAEIREKNQELQASEKRYRLLADNINDVIWMADNELSLTYISPSVRRMLGYSADEVLLHGLKKISAPDSFQKIWKLYDETLKTENEKDSVNELHLTIGCEFLNKDGNALDVELTLFSIIDQRHQAIGVGGIIRDISERVKSQKEKEKFQAQLAQSQKMEAVGTLAGGVAHDFNNMLSVIIGYAELSLHEVAAENRLRKHLDRILDAARRSANLTRQLLAFARKQTIMPVMMDINEAVESALKMIRRLIGENIELVWSPGACSCKIKIDAAQMDQILINLCVNAQDAISGVGRITIETGMLSFDSDNVECPAGHYALLAVSDNGQGMDKETLNHIFEPFYTTKKLGEGTGMGLATVYGIVKQNKGMINVYSEMQLGTTFRIYLPCPNFAQQMENAKIIENTPIGRGEIILLVEDEPVILEMGKEMLQKLGYVVICANTPAEALRLTAETQTTIDLFLTDIIMPEMNGRELIEKITISHPSARFVYMSGYTADVIARQGVLEEGVNFIQKPFSLKELARKVREALDKTPSIPVGRS